MKTRTCRKRAVRDRFRAFLLPPVFFLVYDDKGEPKFPNEELLRLEEQINRVRWTVPVLDKGELIICLRAAVRLAKESTFLHHRLSSMSPCPFASRGRHEK